MVMLGKVVFSLLAPGHWGDPIDLHSVVLVCPDSLIVSQEIA